jgi:hypothetical protein
VIPRCSFCMYIKCLNSPLSSLDHFQFSRNHLSNKQEIIKSTPHLEYLPSSKQTAIKMPILHVSILVADLEASKAFYTSALAPLGYKVEMEFPGAVGYGTPNGKADFWLKSTEGVKVPPIHLAFTGESEKMVDELHAAAL